MANSVTIGTVTPAGAGKVHGVPRLVPIAFANATATFDSTIGNDSAEAFSVTVAGAAIGDFVMVAPSGGDPEPNIFFPYGMVSAADTVEVCVHATNTDTPSGMTGFNIAVFRLERDT